MSSAILYLAIVAIWAVVLVPRWLRPRPEQPVTEQPSEPQPVTPEVVPEVVPGPADADQHEEAEPAEAPAWSRAGVPEEPGAPGEPVAPDKPDAEPVPAVLSPAARRAEVVQGRRRMLAMLVTLTVGAAGLAFTGIAAFWVIIPPTLLLAGFLVLLREAAHADAQRSRHATPVDRAATPPVAGQEPGSFREDVEPSKDQVPVTASAPGTDAAPGAEIIDISARVSDQVYDQYADAADRAVGD